LDAKIEEPIIIRPRGPRGKGRELVTRKEAGRYIAKLPKAEHTATEWQTAMEALLLAVRGGPTMLARIGIMKALHECASSNHRKRKGPHDLRRDVHPFASRKNLASAEEYRWTQTA
jgi:hypothetical protein